MEPAERRVLWNTDRETQLLTNSDCYRAGKTIRPMGIMVHSTGVAQPDPQVFIKSWNQPDKDACVHAW